MAAVERELIRPEDGLALLFTPPFDQVAARSRLHQGLSARHPRERRPIHPCRPVVGDGLRGARRGRQGRRDCSRCSTRSTTPARGPTCYRYKVEPYVVAADVYAEPPHVGRGGWTWYTGSAGWMQRAGIESILGLRQRGEVLHLDPCIPRAWPGSRCRFATVRHAMRSWSKILTGWNGASRPPRSTGPPSRSDRCACGSWTTVGRTGCWFGSADRLTAARPGFPPACRRPAS